MIYVATVTWQSGKAYSKQGKYHGYKTHASMRRLINYITNPEKTREHLIKGVNCSPQNAYEEFVLNKQIWNKTENGHHRMVFHFVQSFAKDDNVTPEMASEIAEKLLQHELFKGFQAIYATHLDTDHIHTHFVIDTCNKETGKQWNISTADEQRIKDYSDQLCREYHLSICQKKENYTVPYRRKNEIEVMKQGTSWKEEIRLAAVLCKENAVSRADFIQKMKDMGITVTWTDSRKYITFKDSQEHKVRNYRFEPVEVFTKEALEEQFLLNRQFEQMQEQAAVEQRDSGEAVPGFRSFLYIAKTLVQAADKPYPLQNTPEFKDLGTKAAMDDYIAERQKGKGIEL